MMEAARHKTKITVHTEHMTVCFDIIRQATDSNMLRPMRKTDGFSESDLPSWKAMNKDLVKTFIIDGLNEIAGGQEKWIPKDILLEILGPSKVYEQVIRKVINSAIAQYVAKEGLAVGEDLQIEQSLEDLEAGFEPGSEFRFDAIIVRGELRKAQISEQCFSFSSFTGNADASDKSKVKRNKMKTAGEKIEYKCLIRATDGKKTISTMVGPKDHQRFQSSYATILKARMTALKKRERKDKRKAADSDKKQDSKKRSAAAKPSD
ncbi:hypothetical protein DH2020_047627 [Rehmannia glutinosa]|uniref:Signal recognition particle 14 kDa protein n=1 Tax=Rehmannia glutinosa TaxID=99300 RepID=A0ABR0U902_REHGL